MKKKFVGLIVFAILSSLLVVGCGNSKEEDKQTSSTEVTTTSQEKIKGGTFTYPIPSDIGSLNRHLEVYKEGHIMLRPIYDALYYVDSNETRYYLAESYTLSDDKLSVTVKLKNNLKWHDGEAITADDFIYTLKVAQDPTSGSGYKTVASVNNKPVKFEKIDDLSVKITLPEISAYYINDLGNLILLPEHAFGGKTDIKNSEASQKGIGSGPYKVKEWKKGQALVLERFDQYYGGVPNFDSVVFRIIPDESAQDIALQNGEISIREANNDTVLNKYEKNDKFDVYSFTEGRVNYMAMNKFSPIFSDFKAQQAVVAALNPSEIVKGAYGSEKIAKLADSTFGPKTFFRDENFEGYKQDLEKAKKLISETGLDKKTIKLIYNTARTHQKETALIIQQQLGELGVKVEITGMESSGFFAKAFSTDKDFDMYLNGYPSAGDPEGLNFMFNIKNINVSDKQRELWLKGNKELDPNKRAEIYKELQQVAKDDITMYPIAYPNFCLIADEHYKGIDTLQTIPVFENYLNLYMVK